MFLQQQDVETPRPLTPVKEEVLMAANVSSHRIYPSTSMLQEMMP
jgi:hypothetical protein